MTSEEFKSSVLPIKDKLYRFSLRLMGDRDDAQDIVQEIFLRLWSKRDKLSEYRNLEAFAMTMTRNLCLDKLKSPAAKKEQIEDKNMTDYRDPYQNAETSDAVSLVKQAMDSLPEQQKMVIHLRDVEGCDFDEIAEISGLSLNNIRVILSRARKKVRDVLIKLNHYEFSKN